ncbi:hypothetical protein ACFSTH_13100 [Paenibacillus yanchengensis]|uniref:ABC transporter permease n=1 Tax=Paenibacillus yanchengensis TaxID=2035833 RepID=A0ABW4YNE1_9BACL
MLRLIYYELRKNYWKRYILLTTLLFLVLNVLMIYRPYVSGDGLMEYFMPHTQEFETEWTFYEEMHQKLDGKITNERAQYVVDEYSRLRELVANRAYSREYQPDTYTGYIWTDYMMITKYIYEPMLYAVEYEENIKQVLDKANANIKFYTMHELPYELAKNEYITKQYKHRAIYEFYDSKTWEKLFTYRLSDAFLLLLVLLGVVPIYVQERELDMDQLILSSKNGKKNMSIAKLLSTILYIAILVSIFAITNITTIHILYGLEGKDMPLYALQSFQYTPLNISVLQFYCLLVFFKFTALVMVGWWIAFFSTLFQQVIYPYILSLLFIIVGLFSSGYFASVSFGKTIVALASPFTLLKVDGLYQELFGINIANHFMLRPIVSLAVQLFTALLLLIIIFRCSTRSMKYIKWSVRKVGE